MTPARPAPIVPLALILTVLLTAWWAALGHRDLGALRLPGADDMLRLAQTRDWIDGQNFADVTQGRLGPPGGTAMPASRLGDVVPGAVIRMLSPLMGTRRAEIAAVVFWPELLFFVHLLLTGAMARRVGGAAAAAPAIALGALAFPAIAFLMPGHIAGQGLELALIEGAVLALLRERPAIAGLSAGAALLIGAQVGPLFLAMALWLTAAWVRGRRETIGFGAGLLTAALGGLAFLRPEIWPGDRCDGFTRPLFVVMLVSGALCLLLGAIGSGLRDRRGRAGAAGLVIALALALVWLVGSACLAAPTSDPFTDPIHASAGTLIAWLALPAIGVVAGILLLRGRQPVRGMPLLLTAAAVPLALSWRDLDQAAFAAAFAAPILAIALQRVRGLGRGAQAALWLASAGLVWQTAGRMIDGLPDPRVASCTDRETLAALDRLDAGTFAAPAELGAYLIGRTQHRSLAGPTLRNARGNRAEAAFFTATPEEARYQANLWTIDYVALCPTASGGLPPALLKPGGLAAHLLDGAVPEWLEPVGLIGSEVSVWRVRGIAASGPRP